MNGIIVGIQTNGNQKLYRVITFNKVDSGEYRKHMVGEAELVNLLGYGSLKLLNATLENGKIKGLTGDLGRFTSNKEHAPMVILSEIVAEDRILGYRMAGFDGVVKTVRIKDVLAYCSRVSGAGVPIQNAMYVPESNNQKAHIRAYPGQVFYRETLERKRAPIAQPAAVNTKENERQVSRIEEIFNPAQIEQLKLGKAHGVNIKVFGNNKLSAEQMQELRLALEDKIDAKLFADPAFSVKTMKALRINAKYGVDLQFFINPKFSAEQIAELSTGYLSGVDISKYADPKLSVKQMAKERIALENKIWREVKAVESKLD